MPQNEHLETACITHIDRDDVIISKSALDTDSV